MNNKNTSKSLTGTGAVKVIERPKEDKGQDRKNCVMLYVVLALIVLMVMIIAAAIYSKSASYHAIGGRNVFDTIIKRYLAAFKFSRSVVFIGIFSLTLVQAFLALFWKPARKFGLFIFYFAVFAIIAVTGQVVDYVTRSNVTQTKSDIGGASFGDYGIVSECGYGGCGYTSKENETKQAEPTPSTPDTNATSNLINDFNYCQTDTHQQEDRCRLLAEKLEYYSKEDPEINSEDETDTE